MGTVLRSGLEPGANIGGWSLYANKGKLKYCYNWGGFKHFFVESADVFSADDGCDVGEDSGAPVSPDYGPIGNGFTGEVKGVQLSIADDSNDTDRLVKPEDAIRAALGRQ